MSSYKVKISALEWFVHIFIVFLAIFLAAYTAGLKEWVRGSIEQVLIHVLIVAGLIYNLFILYRKKTCIIELDTYGIRYFNLKKVNRISFTDIIRIERKSGTPGSLVFFSADKKFALLLNIEKRDEFLDNLIKIVESINYKIEFDKENILKFT